MLDFIIGVYHDQARLLLAIGVPVRVSTAYDNFVKEHNYPPCRVVREEPTPSPYIPKHRYVFLEPEEPEHVK